MCLIRGTWRRKEKKDILMNKMLQQQRKLSKQQPTVHWRIFGLSWPFLFSSQSVCPACKKINEKSADDAALKPGFACFNLLWLDSATTPNLSEKKLTTLLLKSCSVSISGVRIDSIIHTTAAIVRWYDVWPMDKIPIACRLNNRPRHIAKQNCKEKKIEEKKRKNRHRPVIDSMIVICLLLSETSLFTTCLPCWPPAPIYPPWSSSRPQSRLSSDQLSIKTN